MVLLEHSLLLVESHVVSPGVESLAHLDGILPVHEALSKGAEGTHSLFLGGDLGRELVKE
jgi:hypothetical protein